MATSRKKVTSEVFVLASSADDVFIQNVSTTTMLYKFDTTLPLATDTDTGRLGSGEGFQKIAGKPTGNIYVKMANKGVQGYVAVSE